MTDIHWPELNATIRYEAQSHHMDFKVREGTKQDDGLICYQSFNEKGEPEFTNDFAKASRFVDGNVKWDGCSHLDFGDESDALHLCGGRAYRDMFGVLAAVFDLAAKEIPHFNADVADLSAFPPQEAKP